MNINTAPDRCLRAAAEMRRSEQNLRYAAGSIEEVINSLKHSEEESMQIIANKLHGTLEATCSRNRTIRLMYMVLEKAAEMYSRTEAEISDFGETGPKMKPVKVRAQDLGPVKQRTDRIFEKL